MRKEPARPSFVRTYFYNFPLGWSAPKHHHADIWELVQVTQGVMQVSVNGEEIQSAPGGIFIYPPKLVHQEKCLSRIGLAMRTAVWKSPIGAMPKTLPLHTHDYAGRIYQTLGWMQELQTSVGPVEPILNKLLDVLLYECARSRPHLPNDRISRVKDYIQNHASESLQIFQLARIACMSESHFAHEFRRHTHFTPMAYVRKIRLDIACQAITQTDAPLRQIATRAGFRDEFEFSRVFRREMGISPGSLRPKL